MRLTNRLSSYQAVLVVEGIDQDLKPLNDQSNVIEMRGASFGWEATPPIAQPGEGVVV